MSKTAEGFKYCVLYKLQAIYHYGRLKSDVIEWSIKTQLSRQCIKTQLKTACGNIFVTPFLLLNDKYDNPIENIDKKMASRK